VQFKQNQQKVVEAAKPDVAEGQKIYWITLTHKRGSEKVSSSKSYL
jgi:hypothetical protein